MPVTEETFLRELPFSALAQLAETLDINNSWERLASKIPTKPDQIFVTNVYSEPRYTTTDIARFGNSRNSSTKILIRDWSVQNARIKHLVEALYQADLRAAATYIQQEVLHSEPRRSCRENDNSRVISLENNASSTDCKKETVIAVKCAVPCPPSATNCNSSGQELSDQKVDSPPEQLPTKDTEMRYEVTDQLTCFQYHIIQAITNNFDERNHKDGGNLIGEGGFGTVFIGTFSDGYQVAVKCLKNCEENDSLDQFKTELQTLTMFKHENLVLLLGYSISDSGPRCLVYQYMSNGSLEERLACRYNTDPLSNNLRLEITKGTANGIAFLHKGGLVHRDIKSANILLDTDFKPKVGDFATARVLPKGMESHIMKTSVVIGTVAYLAPEAASFHVHPSLDSYSFGVVILEILTGLPVTDPNRAEFDLKLHVQEHCAEGEDGEEPGSFYDLLDTKGGAWSKSVVDVLYSISCRCLEHLRKKRPKMADIVAELERLELIKDGVETE
ncbi:hypothetical protein BsWGS_03254 [Bradybaena similaris]